MWHLQMTHSYCKYLWYKSIDHSNIYCTYIANVKIYTYGSYGTYVFYGICFFFYICIWFTCQWASIQNVHICIHIFNFEISPCSGSLQSPT